MSTLKPPDFLRTIYLGDRACKAIVIDGWNKQVSVEVNLISRIRTASGTWDYNSAEDITDGRIVFTGVDEVHFTPAGPLPNDLINEISVSKVEDSKGDGRWTFVASISSVGADGTVTEVILRLIAYSVHLEDPRRPGIQILE